MHFKIIAIVAGLKKHPVSWSIEQQLIGYQDRMGNPNPRMRLTMIDPVANMTYTAAIGLAVSEQTGLFEGARIIVHIPTSNHQITLTSDAWGNLSRDPITNLPDFTVLKFSNPRNVPVTPPHISVMTNSNLSLPTLLEQLSPFITTGVITLAQNYTKQDYASLFLQIQQERAAFKQQALRIIEQHYLSLMSYLNAMEETSSHPGTLMRLTPESIPSSLQTLLERQPEYLNLLVYAALLPSTSLRLLIELRRLFAPDSPRFLDMPTVLLNTKIYQQRTDKKHQLDQYTMQPEAREWLLRNALLDQDNDMALAARFCLEQVNYDRLFKLNPRLQLQAAWQLAIHFDEPSRQFVSDHFNQTAQELRAITPATYTRGPILTWLNAIEILLQNEFNLYGLTGRITVHE